MSPNDILVKKLVKEGYLRTSVITRAFRGIDRGDFVSGENIKDAHLDIALPIGYGQTISQPLTVAFMLELLQPEPADNILDIGTGSGWKAALLSYITGSEGTVISIERIPELKEIAERNIAKYNFLEKEILKILLMDGSKGAPPDLIPKDGFDKIIAGAAGNDIPKAWKEQLKIGGRIVAPVKDGIMVLDKISKEEFETKEFYGFSFVPLIID